VPSCGVGCARGYDAQGSESSQDWYEGLAVVPSVRLRDDSAEDTPKHQILPLKMAKDYLMVPCQYAEDRWGYAPQRLVV
jgi:hypothetical protein